ncbi:hypothetical protein ACFLZW_07520 [Chloroflexota bacterium]
MMSNPIDLREIERRAQRAYYQDGLMELLLGVYLILVGGMLATESKLMPFTVFAVFLIKPVWDRLKARYTFPRIGFVEFPEDAQAGKGILKTLALFFVVAAVLAVGLTYLLGGERGWDFFLFRILPAMIGVLLACGPVYAADTYGLKRWWFIAVLFVLSGVLAPFAGAPDYYTTIGLQISLVGVVALLMGLWLAIVFMRKHPILEEEGINAAG